jgi:hypothetical protein
MIEHINSSDRRVNAFLSTATLKREREGEKRMKREGRREKYHD